MTHAGGGEISAQGGIAKSRSFIIVSTHRHTVFAGEVHLQGRRVGHTAHGGECRGADDGGKDGDETEPKVGQKRLHGW